MESKLDAGDLTELLIGIFGLLVAIVGIVLKYDKIKGMHPPTSFLHITQTDGDSFSDEKGARQETDHFACFSPPSMWPSRR